MVQVAFEALIRNGHLLEVGGHWVRMEVIAGDDDRLRNGLVQPLEDLNRDKWNTTTTLLAIIVSLTVPAASPSHPSTPHTVTPRMLLLAG